MKPRSAAAYGVVNADDMRMRQLAREGCLGDEQFTIAPAVLLVAERFLHDHLHRDVAIDERIEGFVHDARRAFAKLADDFVLADLFDSHLVSLGAVWRGRLASKYNTIKLDICVTCNDFAHSRSWQRRAIE
ncbi:MAG TPA: hypothetical protein VEW70_15625 [Burkholderiales bacterium]|nr:hypothetical protein [Burkholderiales bacterium]